MGERIVKKNMKYLGSLLKGLDLKDDKTIRNGDFYRLISALPEFTEPIDSKDRYVLKEGDILDLIKELDE